MVKRNWNQRKKTEDYTKDQFHKNADAHLNLWNQTTTNGVKVCNKSLTALKGCC